MLQKTQLLSTTELITLDSSNHVGDDQLSLLFTAKLHINLCFYVSLFLNIIQYDSNCISRDHEGLRIFTPRNQPKRKLKLPSKRNGCIGWVHISPEMF